MKVEIYKIWMKLLLIWDKRSFYNPISNNKDTTIINKLLSNLKI
jgi:hypothetical protein